MKVAESLEKIEHNHHAESTIKLEIPTAKEIFEKPYPPAPPLPPAWQGDSIAVELADRECARLRVNAHFDPPITEEEITAYAKRFRISIQQAELEIRRDRNAN